MRDVRAELAAVNRYVGAQVSLNDVDLHCLDVLSRAGAVGPGALARLTGLHPATMTGVLDRLERGGWVVRERAAEDRRGVVVQVVPGRLREMFGAYSGMNERLDEICAGYTDEELEVIKDFLDRTATAGRAVAAEGKRAAP